MLAERLSLLVPASASRFTPFIAKERTHPAGLGSALAEVVVVGPTIGVEILSACRPLPRRFWQDRWRGTSVGRRRGNRDAMPEVGFPGGRMVR